MMHQCIHTRTVDNSYVIWYCNNFYCIVVKYSTVLCMPAVAEWINYSTDRDVNGTLILFYKYAAVTI